MLRVTLNDKTLEVREGTTCLQVLQMADPDLAQRSLATRLDGQVVGLTTPLMQDGALIPLTFDDEDGRRALRHTASHILAQAVLRLFPEAKLAIGPATESGFYYDFDLPEPFTPEDLTRLEAEMQAIIDADLPLERLELPRAEAMALMAGQPYKQDLLERLGEDATLSFYRQGSFTDLCAGPHVPSTGYVKAFRLTSLAGAYWHGDAKQPMLQRVYGTAYQDEAGLAAYLERLEEAKRRDHRKLGRQLDLFDVYDEGPGFPFFLPRGMVLRNLLEDFWREAHRRHGYQEIRTPMLLSQSLWRQSGHWEHYRDNMFVTQADGQDYALKPMNCTGGMLVYRRKLHSYKDLPQRMAELGLVHRHELSGTLHGLMRAHCFTQDDAHIFMTSDQMQSEISGVIQLIDDFYRVFGFSYTLELSTRPENSMGTDEAWEAATAALVQALEANGKAYTVNEGDGAFYGPKIDFHLQDCLGRTWQCGTIQLDFQMPERFDLSYIGPDNQRHRPVMVHRVVFGSIERFIAILTEHFAGAFPLWLAPVQVVILPITDAVVPYAQGVLDELLAQGFRVEMDARQEKIGYRIREAQVQKIPYMVVVGGREAESHTLSVRSRKSGESQILSLGSFAAYMKRQISSRSL